MRRPLALVPFVALALAAPAAATSGPPPGTPVDTAYSCPRTTANEYDVIAPNQAVEIPVVGGSETATVSLVRLERDGATTTVRTGTGNPTWTVRLPENTRLSLFGTGSNGSPCGGGGPAVTRAVRATLTITAVRNAPRDYSFAGRVTPGRGQIVGLYRLTEGGHRVLVEDAVVAADGTYRMDRRFLGSGRFGFEVRVSDSATNLAGASPVRPTVVH